MKLTNRAIVILLEIVAAQPELAAQAAIILISARDGFHDLFELSVHGLLMMVDHPDLAKDFELETAKRVAASK